MQVLNRIQMVASGHYGLELTSPYDCNVYLVDAGTERLLVDAGSGLETERVLSGIESAGVDALSIGTIVLTHRHADHAGGAASLQRSLGCRILATSSTIASIQDEDGFNRGLDRARRSGGYPADYVFRTPDRCEAVAPGERIEIGESIIGVHDASGHCDGHLALTMAIEGRLALFSGDSLLPGGLIVPQILPDFDVVASATTIENFETLAPDHLLAGHLSPVVDEAASHIARAMNRIRAGRLPTSLFDADLSGKEAST